MFAGAEHDDVLDKTSAFGVAPGERVGDIVGVGDGGYADAYVCVDGGIFLDVGFDEEPVVTLGKKSRTGYLGFGSGVLDSAEEYGVLAAAGGGTIDADGADSVGAVDGEANGLNLFLGKVALGDEGEVEHALAACTGGQCRGDGTACLNPCHCHGVIDEGFDGGLPSGLGIVRIFGVGIEDDGECTVGGCRAQTSGRTGGAVAGVHLPQHVLGLGLASAVDGELGGAAAFERAEVYLGHGAFFGGDKDGDLVGGADVVFLGVGDGRIVGGQEVPCVV